MTTWATLLSNVRIMLDDTETEYRWSDAELLLYCKRALDAYSAFFPMHGTSSPTGATAGQFTLTSDWTLVKVSHETDAGYENFLEKLPRDPGKAMHYHSEGWWRVGDTLYVYPTTLEDIKVYYTTFHTHPTGGTSTLTVPALDETLIEMYICGKAMDRYVGKDAILSRFKEYGKRDDNPVIIARRNWMKDFEQGIAQRLAGRRSRLRVRGRDRVYGA